jgi:hypothetical protein
MEVAAKCPRCGSDFEIEVVSQAIADVLRRGHPDIPSGDPLPRVCGACLIGEPVGRMDGLASRVRRRLGTDRGR